MKISKADQKTMRDLGRYIIGPFFGMSLEGSGLFYDFLTDLCKQTETVQERDKEIRDSIFSKITDSKAREAFDYELRNLPAHTDPLLAIGFVLGAMFEVTDSKAQAEIDLIHKLMKQEKVFEVVPRRKGRMASKEKGERNPDLIEKCSFLFNCFEGENSEIGTFVSDVGGVNDALDHIDRHETHNSDELLHATMNLYEMAFVFGMAVGQLIEVKESRFQNRMEPIKELIVNRGFLNYRYEEPLEEGGRP